MGKVSKHKEEKESIEGNSNSMIARRPRRNRRLLVMETHKFELPSERCYFFDIRATRRGPRTQPLLLSLSLSLSLSLFLFLFQSTSKTAEWIPGSVPAGKRQQYDTVSKSRELQNAYSQKPTARRQREKFENSSNFSDSHATAIRLVRVNKIRSSSSILVMIPSTPPRGLNHCG